MKNDEFVYAEAFDEELNFWKSNPELKMMSGFKPIWDIDKGKKESSDIMWAVYLFTDLRSKFRRMSENERISEITETFGSDVVNFKNPLVKQAIEYYRRVCMTTAQRNFAEWEDMLNQRTEFLKSVSWDLETASDKDAMLGRTGKLWDMYTKLKDEMEKEEATGTLKGGGVKSFIEGLG